MKHVKIISQIIIYSFVFFLPVNISDAKPHKYYPKLQDCRAELEQINHNLKQDEDGILNEDQIPGYEHCVANVEHEMENTDGWLNKVSNFIFLLDCYDNLLDYYDEEGDHDKVEEYEEKIYDITE